MKVQKHTRDLSEQDRLDITLMWETPGILTKFALNYRAFINEKWQEVYRVDNYHGFLHEQRYWRSPKPISITDKEGWALKMVFDMYVDEIVSNFQRYRVYYEEALRKDEIKR